jgi:mevalonate kinase
LQLKIYSLKWKAFFTEKFRLDPLNSYLSIPILINSKDNIEATGIPNQTLGKRRCVLLDSGIVGETAYGHYLHGNKGFA